MLRPQASGNYHSPSDNPSDCVLFATGLVSSISENSESLNPGFERDGKVAMRLPNISVPKRPKRVRLTERNVRTQARLPAIDDPVGEQTMFIWSTMKSGMWGRTVGMIYGVSVDVRTGWGVNRGNPTQSISEALIPRRRVGGRRQGVGAAFTRIRACGARPGRVLVWQPGLQLPESRRPRRRITQIMHQPREQRVRSGFLERWMNSEIHRSCPFVATHMGSILFYESCNTFFQR